MGDDGYKLYVCKQLELYSNSIVAFVVIQGLAYSYYFGTNEFFRLTVQGERSLAIGLIVFQAVGAAMAVYAVHQLGCRLRELQPTYRSLLLHLFRGKQIAIFMFGLLPIIVTLRYGGIWS